MSKPKDTRSRWEKEHTCCGCGGIVPDHTGVEHDDGPMHDDCFEARAEYEAIEEIERKDLREDLEYEQT